MSTNSRSRLARLAEPLQITVAGALCLVSLAILILQGSLLALVVPLAATLGLLVREGWRSPELVRRFRAWGARERRDLAGAVALALIALALAALRPTPEGEFAAEWWLAIDTASVLVPGLLLLHTLMRMLPLLMVPWVLHRERHGAWLAEHARAAAALLWAATVFAALQGLGALAELTGLVAWLAEHPRTAAAWGAPVLLGASLAFLPALRRSALNRGGSGAITPYFSAAERRRTAAHEAGHVLVTAALEPRPEGIEARVLARRAGRFQGFVRLPLAAGGALTDDALRWHLRLALAGIAGERVCGESNTGGHGQDVENFHRAASLLLASDPAAGFVRAPRSEAEQAHNMRLITRLADHELAALEAFFHRNGEPLIQARAHLLEHGVLRGSALDAILNRVEIPGDWPRPGEVPRLPGPPGERP